MPLNGLLEKAAGAAAQLTTNALRVRRERPRMVAVRRVVVVRKGVVRRMVLRHRLQALAGWCVSGKGHRSLQIELVCRSSSFSDLLLSHEVGMTRGRVELALCESPRCRRNSRRRMRQRVRRRLKQQGQPLGAGYGYLMMIRPQWMEAQLRRYREVSWWLKAEAKPSPEGAAGTSRPPCNGRIDVGKVAIVRDGQVDVEPHQFHCSTGMMVPGGENSEPYMVGTVLDSGAGISCVSEATVCALKK